MERSHSWSSARSWKDRVPKGTGGSNPLLSARQKYRIFTFGIFVWRSQLTFFKNCLYLSGILTRSLGSSVRHSWEDHMFRRALRRLKMVFLVVPEDAEVRAETSVGSNAFQINVESTEWQALYKNRQEGSHPIVVIRHNGIQSWLPRWGGVLHHSFVERPIFAGARVQSFWNVGAVEKVSANTYRVTASKAWEAFVLASISEILSSMIAFLVFEAHFYTWSRSWNCSLHHV